MMTSTEPTATACTGPRVAVLRGDNGSIVGLRLSRVSKGTAIFRPATPPEFWSAVHRAGLTVSVRWIVFPASTVGPPGHIEIYVLAHDTRSRQPALVADELDSLLLLGFPQLRFQPVQSEDELLFALAPFGTWAWCVALERSRPPARRRPVGFGQEGEAAAAKYGSELYRFVPEQADPAQSVFVLANCPGASMLEWTLAPAERLAADGRHLAVPAGLLPEDRKPPPLAFDCQILWTGSAGSPPLVLGASVAQALGAREAAFQPVTRTLASGHLALALGEPTLSSQLTVAHDSLPSVLPPPDAVAAVHPALRAPVQPRLPDAELPEAGAPLGRTWDGRLARLSVHDRLRHVWILGQTGTGKSTLLLNQVLQDIEEGHGVAVFDPHGEIEAIRKRIPASRREDVVLIDVADRRREPPAVNLLECADVESAHMRAGQVIELITSLWPKDYCGPIWQQACLYGLLLLAARFEEPGAIADLPRLFLDDDFRKQWLRSPGLSDRVPQAISWWTDSYAKYSSTTRSESLDYYISKFSLFFTDPVLRAILGQPRSTIDLRQIMDRRGVLLCSLARGGVNPMATTLLTGVFMQSALNAALSRADIPADRRTPFFVYCDEFQRIVGPSTGAILSEVRKYGLGLVLAHQFIDQLQEETLAAVLGNVGTKIIFRVGARDAQRLVAYQPSLTAADLIRMPNFTALAELLVSGVPSAPITLFMPPPPPESAEPWMPAAPALEGRDASSPYWSVNHFGPPPPPPRPAGGPSKLRPPSVAEDGPPLTFRFLRGDGPPREVRIAGRTVRIGRAPTSDLRINDPEVSRMHAVVEVDDAGDVYLTDLGAANPTEINGEPVSAKCKLESGDTLRFGRNMVVFIMGDGNGFPS